MKATAAALGRLERTSHLLRADRADPAMAGAAATDYLRLFALTALGWMWTRMASKAVVSGNSLHLRKCALADFFADRMLPQTEELETSIAAGGASIMTLDGDLF